MCKEDIIKIVFVISSSHRKPNLSTNGDSFDGFAEAKMAPAVADLKAMTDAFEGIDKLAEGAPRTDGAPNFRRVISYLHHQLQPILNGNNQTLKLWDSDPRYGKSLAHNRL